MAIKRLATDQRRAIAAAAAAGATKAQLKRRFHVSAGTVARWVAEGRRAHPNVADAARSGRPRKLGAPQRSAAKRAARRGRTAPQITSSLNKTAQQQVSRSTTVRVLKGGQHPLCWGLVNHGRRLSNKNTDLRVDFCKRHRGSQTGTWVFVDSKVLYVWKSGKRRVRCKWGNNPKDGPPRTSSNPITLHFYGAVARGFKSRLYFTDPTPPSTSHGHKGPAFNAKSFQRDVLPRLAADLQAHYGSRPYRVVLDHAKQHTAASTKAAMDACAFPLLEGYPPQCWDINIIECVWAQLANATDARRPTTPRGGRRIITECWQAIGNSTINKLVDSVKERMQKIVDVDGAWLSVYHSKG